MQLLFYQVFQIWVIFWHRKVMI